MMNTFTYTFQESIQPLRVLVGTTDNVRDLVDLALNHHLVVVLHRIEPHLEKHFSDQLLDALLVVDSSNHFDADFGYPLEIRVLDANVPKDLDDSLPDRDSSVLK